ncbi:MAG: M50 family metallopeptidase [Anaerolineales bacterium]
MELILFIVAIALLIVVHELGHFLAAKVSGIKVTEFGLGFPPRVLRLFKWGGTDFTLNAIPLGGFVRPAGENDPAVPGGLAAARPWTRIFVLISGPAMNILVAFLITTYIFFQIGKPDLDTVQVMQVAENSPASLAGLRAGDLIVQVNDEPIDSAEELHNEIYAHLGELITVVYLRDGEEFTISLTPRDPPPADQGAIGISMGHPRLPISPLEAISVGWQAIGEQSRALVELPGRLISGEASSGEGRLVGYKGMYDIFTTVREADAAPESNLPAGINTLYFFASISVSLGILNLLPVPALDGGRILFTLPEILFRRRIPQAYENMVNLIGLGLLLLLIVFINIQDFINPIIVP